MGVNKGSNLNPGHSEIGDLKVNCDWSLRLQLFTLHTRKPKVRPHHVLLTTLHIQKQTREKATELLTALHVVHKAFQIKRFV